MRIPRSAAIGLQAGEVSKHNRMVRFMVRGYLMTETEQSLQQLQQQFSTLQAAVDRLDAPAGRRTRRGPAAVA